MLFENENSKTSHSEYYLQKVEIKDYKVKINGKNIFDQPINNNTKTYENVRKIASGQGGAYTSGCLLDYLFFKENYKIIAIDLIKQQVLDDNSRAIQQINLSGNLDRVGDTIKSKN